ncbi:hypothetical protein GCM10009744_12620 [Kribbella alba]|uniref:Uncharacterized protein n=1 Tax=Kribbella alba TaxID=190197 RepID=A0ABN2F3X6_9ACTN
MTVYNATDQGAGEAQGAESIDLLIRHLEAAKRVFSSPEGTPTQDEGELKAFPNTVCTLLYAQPGTFCPLLYLHFPAVTEAVTESARVEATT